tara:strand:- start:127 stop:669 length:543 start_codon:yes stop_codon:yes gene_type:complete
MELKKVYRFKLSDYPPEKLIKYVIKKANQLAPMKNDEVSFDIDIYGPDWLIEKEKLCVQTVCDEKHKELTLKELSYMYDNELAQFNHQVKAPYLLVYRKKSVPYNYEIASINAGIHGYAVSLIAKTQGIQSSFCACFDDKGDTNKILKKRNEIFFMLSLGFEEKGYERKKKPKKVNTTWH